MIKATDLNITEKRIHALLCARSGHGKSEAAKSFPKPMYWICTDNRLAALQGVEGIIIDIFDPKKGFGDIEKAIETNILNKIGPNFPWKTVVYAGISKTIRALRVDSLKYIDSTGEGDKSKGAMRYGNLTIPGTRNHLYVSEAMHQLFENGLSRIPCHFLCEAHIVNSYDAKGDVDGRKLLATDKLAETIPGDFDEMWEFGTKQSVIESAPTKYVVKFHSTIARSAIIKNRREIEWTDKDFYNDILLRVIESERVKKVA